MIRGLRIGLGVCAIAVSILWTLFIGGVALAYLGWPTGLAVVSVGVCMFLVGLYLVLGRRPGRLGWLAAGAAVTAVIFGVGIQASRDAQERAAVHPVVERAYVKRSGIADVTADCDSDPTGDGEGWICTLALASGAADRCYVSITTLETGRLTAAFDGCRGDMIPVNVIVQHAYLKRSSLASVRADCYESVGWAETWIRKGPHESRDCYITWGSAACPSEDYCDVTVTRRDRGRVSARIISCESDGSR